MINFIIKITSMKKVKFDFVLLVLALISIPGIKIQGSLINFCDIFIPYLFFKYLYKSNFKIAIDKNNVFFDIYVFVSFFSIIIAELQTEIVGFVNYLKLVRLVYVGFCFFIFSVQSRYLSIVFCNLVIVSAGIVSIIESIIIYLLQTTYFCSLGDNLQTFNLNGRIMYRAGGIFGEPIAFSLVCCIVIVCASALLIERQYVLICITAIMGGGIGIVLSGSRTSVVALLVIGIYLLLSTKWKYKIEIIIASGVILGIILIFYRKNLFFYNFMNAKIFALVDAIIAKKSSDYNALSSGRITNWKRIISLYGSSDLVNYMFGYGYKVDRRSIVIDNNYISWLWGTGLVGTVTMIIYWTNKFFMNIKIKSQSQRQRMSIVVFWFSIMLFVDSMTIYRFFSISLMIMNYHLIDRISVGVCEINGKE